MNNYEKLTTEVLERSASKNEYLAFQEWDEVYTYVLSVFDDEPETCLCGKHPIYEIFVLRNRITDEKITVGNVCIRRFRRGNELEKLIKDYKKVKKDTTKRLSVTSLNYLKEHSPEKFTHYKFYCARAGKKKKSLNDVELSIIRKVNVLFIDLIERKDTDRKTVPPEPSDVPELVPERREETPKPATHSLFDF